MSKNILFRNLSLSDSQLDFKNYRINQTFGIDFKPNFNWILHPRIIHALPDSKEELLKVLTIPNYPYQVPKDYEYTDDYILRMRRERNNNRSGYFAASALVLAVIAAAAAAFVRSRVKSMNSWKARAELEV
jgi:hypothetical protein